MNYKIADFPVEIKGIKHELFTLRAQKYETDENAEVTFQITDEDIDFERKIEPSIDSVDAHEYTAVLRKFGEFLPLHNGFVLHSACFDVEGVGVAFAAHSGTGKTTHMRRWKAYLGDRFKVVNGDKPMVRFFDDEPEVPYAYGNPWKGKENFGKNRRTPLKHICFIERADTNYVEKVSKNDIIDAIMNQVYLPQNSPLALINTMQLIDRLLSCCELWKIHCNMDDDAGEIAYKAIFEE